MLLVQCAVDWLSGSSRYIASYFQVILDQEHSQDFTKAADECGLGVAYVRLIDSKPRPQDIIIQKTMKKRENKPGISESHSSQ